MSRLLVVEGDGDAAFFRQLLKTNKLTGFAIHERRSAEGQEVDLTTGITAFGTVLETLQFRSDFDEIELVVLVADCDSDAKNSFNSVVRQIRSVPGYAVPKKARQVATEDGKKSTSVLMLPWDDEPGCLETVCYDVASRDQVGSKITKCVDEFVACVGTQDWLPQKKSKLELRCYISASCPKDPNTGLQYAWGSTSRRRPQGIIPLDSSKNKMLGRIAGYLKGLP